MSYSHKGTKTAGQMEEAHQAKLDATPTVTRCLCGWLFEGPAGEGREKARAHRAKAHPELPLKATRPKGPKVKHGLEGGGNKFDDGWRFNPRDNDKEQARLAEVMVLQRRAAGLAVERRKNEAA